MIVDKISSSVEMKNALTLLDVNIISVVKVIEHLKVNVTRTSIRDFFLNSPNYPVVSLYDICSALESWNIETISSKIPKQMILKAPTPFLAFIEEDKKIFFVLVTHVDEKEVIYIHPSNYYDAPNKTTFIKKNLIDFFANWDGLIVIFSTNEASGEKDFFEKKSTEEFLKKKYQDSIKVIDNFISDEECDNIIKYSEEKGLFRRSMIGAGDGIVSEYRTSDSAKLEEKELPVFSKIINNSIEITGNDINQLEKLQAARYTSFQKFSLHFDTSDELVRKHTGVLYLNDDFTGGETFFSELNYKIIPKKGRVVFFSSLDENRILPIYSAHASLPVIDGAKYICVILFREEKVNMINK